MHAQSTHIAAESIASFSAVATLTAQAILLDQLFTKAAQKSLQAENAQEEKRYTAVALKTHHYCRQTILTISKLQKDAALADGELHALVQSNARCIVESQAQLAGG